MMENNYHHQKQSKMIRINPNKEDTSDFNPERFVHIEMGSLNALTQIQDWIQKMMWFCFIIFIKPEIWFILLSVWLLTHANLITLRWKLLFKELLHSLRTRMWYWLEPGLELDVTLGFQTSGEIRVSGTITLLIRDCLTFTIAPILTF